MTWRRRVTPRVFAVVALLSVLAPLVPGVERVAHAETGCAASTSSDDVSDLLQSDSTGIIGSDYPRSFALPDGRALWLFQDVFVGPPGTPTLNSARFMHNAALIQVGECFTRVTGGTEASPASYIGASMEVPLRRWFWVLGGGMGADGQLHVFVAEFVNAAGTGAAPGATPVATWRATIRTSDLVVTSFTPAADAGQRPLYGFSVTSDDSWSYLYGNCYRQFTNPTGWGSFDTSCTLDNYVARVPKGRFDLAPTYWNGSTWTSNRASAAVVHRAGTYSNPLQVWWSDETGYVAASHLDDWFGNSITMYQALRPTGPFTAYGTQPVPSNCGFPCTTYFAGLHGPDPDGLWFSGISNFTWEFGLANANPALYRPSLVQVPTPPSPRAVVRGDGTIELLVAGREGVPDSVDVAVLTIAATNSTWYGYVTVWPCDEERPLASNVNMIPGRSVANAVLAAVGSDGRVCLWPSTPTDLVVDLQGWYDDASDDITPVSPARVLDTRAGHPTVDLLHMAGGELAPFQVREFAVAGRAGLPDEVGAVALNLTTTGAATTGYVTMWPCGERPLASNINLDPGQNVPNLVISGVSSSGTVCVMSTTRVHLAIDVQTWFAPATDAHQPVAAMVPARLFDSRTGHPTVDGVAQAGGSIRLGDTVVIPVSGRATIGAPVAVSLNLTVVGALTGGYFTLWPCEEPRPVASNVNFVAGVTRAAATITSVGPSGTVCAWMGGGAGPVHLAVDATAWFDDSTDYEAVSPVRLVDTRE